MQMKRILVIPLRNEIEKSLELAEKYNAGFEFNDFFMPDVLDHEERRESIIAEYRALPLPELKTSHGAFYDVKVFSPDKRIREISALRVRQSIDTARELKAEAVVFHTNHDPFLNTPAYIEQWLGDNERYWSGILAEFPDINIYIENMFDRNPDVIGELSERLCRFENYGVCFDYAHAALSDVPHREWVGRLGKYIRHVHINDNCLDCDSHLAVGDGKIDWNEFYSLYEKHMSGATVLAETSNAAYQQKSLEKLRSDGFIP